MEDTNAVEVRPAAGSPAAKAPAQTTAQPAFPDWTFAPNIGNHPGIYEIENAALDRGGHVLDLMRQLAPWSGRTIVDLGCGTGFWLPRYAEGAGRVIGIPEYQLTAVVWIRGILAEHYGVPLDSVHYRTGGLDMPGRVEKLQIEVPPGVDVQPIPADRILSDMLVTGEIDAVCCPRTPRPFAEGRPEVRRLFADPRAEEERYFTQTGIFPIMHTVVLRRDVYERRRWLAQSLYKAFEEARARTADRLAETAASPSMIPGCTRTWNAPAG